MSDATFVFELESDVYRVQRRPGHNQLVVNDDYRGLLVVDPWRGEMLARIQFADSYASSGAIDSWCLRADGDAAVVFNDGDQRACWFSLADHATCNVAHPSWRITTGMPYDWRGDTLWLKDPDASAFVSLRREGSNLMLAKQDRFDVLQENRAWLRTLDGMGRTGARCLRVESDRARFLFIAAKADASCVGIVGWLDQPELRLPAPVPAFGELAAHEQQLIVLQEYEALLLSAEGQVVRRFPAPESFHFVDLDTLPAGNGRPAALVLAAQALDGRLLTRITLYALEPR
jgi:hypothetical protein